jgi:hypothetical protein
VLSDESCTCFLSYLHPLPVVCRCRMCIETIFSIRRKSLHVKQLFLRAVPYSPTQNCVHDGKATPHRSGRILFLVLVAAELYRKLPSSSAASFVTVPTRPADAPEAAAARCCSIAAAAAGGGDWQRARSHGNDKRLAASECKKYE